MKREFLEGLDLGNGVKLSKAAIDTIMAENGKDIEEGKNSKNTIATLTTERDGLREQLETANATIKSYTDMDIDGIRQAAKEWETKYNTDTAALQAQLEAANYGFAVKEAVAGIRFSSESAKKAFLADLTAKKLPLQNGKLLGLEDYTKTYQDSDPGAFVSEEDDKTPVFVRGTAGTKPTGGNDALRAAFGLPEMRKE
jgi:hypothetical protein